MKVTYLFLILLIISCRSPHKSTVEDQVVLKLHNSDLKYNFDLDSIDTYVYSSDVQRKKSTNTVKLTLHNFTDKKLLFLTNTKYLYNVYSFELNIFEEGIKKKISRINVTPTIEENDRNRIKAYMDYHINMAISGDNIVKTGNESIIDIYERQRLIVGPGEYRNLSYILSIPIVMENELLPFVDPVIFKFEPDKNYTFSITYKIDAEKLRKSLSDEQQKELMDNGIEIFDGILETEQIPIINTFVKD